MKKQYITPSIIERECHIQAVLHPVSGAKLTTGANFGETRDADGIKWNGGNGIGVSNDEMQDKDTWGDFM